MGFFPMDSLSFRTKSKWFQGLTVVSTSEWTSLLKTSFKWDMPIRLNMSKGILGENGEMTSSLLCLLCQVVQVRHYAGALRWDSPMHEPSARQCCYPRNRGFEACVKALRHFPSLELFWRHLTAASRKDSKFGTTLWLFLSNARVVVRVWSSWIFWVAILW